MRTIFVFCLCLFLVGCSLNQTSSLRSNPPELPRSTQTGSCVESHAPLALLDLKLGDSVEPLLARLGEPMKVGQPDKFGAVLFEYNHLAIVVGSESKTLRILDLEDGAPDVQLLRNVKLGNTKGTVLKELISLGLCPADTTGQEFTIYRDQAHLSLNFKDDRLVRARLALIGS